MSELLESRNFAELVRNYAATNLAEEGYSEEPISNDLVSEITI
jgi:hypothetical protein